MFSTKVRAIFATGSLFVSVFVVFSFTDTGSNMAAVITGVPTDSQKCILELGDEILQTDYQISKTRLNNDTQYDYVLKATKDDLCGSAGCVYQLCVVTDRVAKIIPFGYAAEKLTVKNTLTNGMQDIQLTGKSTINLQWDGTRYTIIK